MSRDPFDDFSPFQFFAAFGAAAILLNVIVWGSIIAIILVALHIAGVI